MENYKFVKCPGCGEGIQQNENQEELYCELCHMEFYADIEKIDDEDDNNNKIGA
jgi:NADH pyrophosphatase NudC (nudix superfamily)